MPDYEQRILHRDASVGGPREKKRAELSACRAEGHSWAGLTRPDPNNPCRVLSIRWCWRCLSSMACLEQGPDSDVVQVGKYGLVAALSSTGRAHIVSVIPPWKPVPVGRCCVPALRHRRVLEGLAPALCPAFVELPPPGTALNRALEISRTPISCKHCMKLTEGYVPDGDMQFVIGNLLSLSLPSIVQTRTHYVLRYGGPLNHPDVSNCGECMHPSHFHFDCVEDGCECTWSLEPRMRIVPGYRVANSEWSQSRGT